MKIKDMVDKNLDTYEKILNFLSQFSPDTERNNEYGQTLKYFFKKENILIKLNKTHDEICFFKSKTIYSKLAQFHRIDGPAIIGKYGLKIFYINNEILNQDQWEKHPEVLKKKLKEKILLIKE